MGKAMKKPATSGRLDAWARGQIVAYAKAGMAPVKIARKVRKADGTLPKVRSVQKTICKAKADPSWRGQNSAAGGRPPILSSMEKKELTRLVFRKRGKAIVTVSYCKQALPNLRRVSDFTVRSALHEAGLKWLRR